MKNLFLRSVLILLGILTFPIWGYSQFYVGFGTGLSLSGLQDHKFIHYDSNNKILTNYKTEDIDGNASMLSDIYLTYWGSGYFKDYSFRLDYFDWTYTSSVDEFPTGVLPSFSKIEQERISLFLSVLKRMSVFKAENNFVDNNYYLFFGLGAGVVQSEIDFGAEDFGLGFQFLSGISIPAISDFRFVAELRYLLAPDADANPSPGWQVHTSGTSFPIRFGKHLDTRFFALNLGFEYLIK